MAPSLFSCLAQEPIKHPIDMNHQSDVLKGPEMIRVSKFYKDSKEGKFITSLDKDTRTLYETFRKGAKESNNGPCLGWRESQNKPYQWLHYNEALLRAKNFGSGLVALGLSPSPNTFIGIYSQNCPEWVLTEQGAYCYSMVIVPLYDTLGPDACAYIIKQAEINVVICEDDTKCNLLLDKAPRCLRKLIIIKETRPATNQRAKNRGVEMLRFEDVEKLGAAKDNPEVPPKTTDLCTVCYTSGTTGNPKGVMLSHENVVAAVCAVILQLGDQRPRSDDIMMSFLPLAHMLERCCENGVYLVGGAVGFFCGDIKRLPEDMKALRPTVMPAVPRLLNRIYDKVMTEISGSFIKRVLFNMAMSAKESEIRRGIIRNNSFWDKLVFRKVQEGMGGRLRLVVVGSAPLAGNILTFIRCSLGALVVEGYGQTECVAPISLTVQGDHVPDHVGPPVACCCVKLVDVPEMEYYAINGQGEVCVKGTNVFQGYYKEDEKTSETIDSNGWHHTGDVGMWLPNGTLKIIDRKKHIFKLSQGEYIVPEKIETIYIRSQYVQQVFVCGESLKSCIVAVVVPDVDVIKSWACENRIPGTLSVLCAHPEVKQLIMDDMISWGKEAGLRSFEQVKDIYLHPDPFSVQNGLLTPTMKSKRPQLKAYFKLRCSVSHQHQLPLSASFFPNYFLNSSIQKEIMAGPGIKEKLGVEEITRGIWKVLLAEFLGNLLLNFYGCASCVGTGDGKGAVLIALTFGLVIMAIVQTVGHVSGAHVNPAVTCGLLAAGNISILKALLYIIVQCLGAVAGTGVLKALTPTDAQKGLGITKLADGVTPVQGFGIEFFLGFVLVLVVFGVCDVNRPEVKGLAPLAIGLTIAMGHLAVLDYTGSSMNPARTLGSAVIIGIWDNHWVYWLGPILGGVSAALIYKHAFSAVPVEVTTDYTPVQLKRLDNKKDEDGMA